MKFKLMEVSKFTTYLRNHREALFSLFKKVNISQAY